MPEIAATASAWRITYIYDDPTVSQPVRDALTANVNAALQYVSAHVNGLGTIDLELHVTPTGGINSRPLGGVGLPGKAPDGNALTRSGIAAEMLTGNDPNGPAQPDGQVNIAADLLNLVDTGPGFWLDPTPLDRSDAVPAAKVEFFHVFVHEILHLIGMSGTRDPNDPTKFPGNSETEFDAQTSFINGAPYFTGAATQAVHNNTPLALEPSAQGSKYYHIAISEGLDMINYTTPHGTRFEYSKYDLAILRDLGMSLINTATAGTDYFFGDDTGEALSPGAGDDFVMGYGGNDTIDGGAGTNVAAYRGKSTDYTIVASGSTLIVTDKVANRDGVDTLTNIQSVQFTDKTLSGSALPGGKFAFHAGSEEVVGTSFGRDTFTETGARSQWTATRLGDGSINLVRSGETDHLTGVERIVFSDGVLIADAGSNALPAYRLYQAAFARVPDEAGLLVQAKLGLDPMVAAQVAAGRDNTKAFSIFTCTEAQYFADVQLAQNFLGSTEFLAKYGANPTNDAFVTLLYQNVLGRSPDAGGLAAQVGALNAGTSRATLLANFAESNENVALTGTNTANGMLWSTFPDTTI
jgi:hypothetical protein